MLTEAHFSILEVTRFSNAQEIRIAYVVQIKLWHPDNFFNDITKCREATERTQKINEAYELLKDYKAPTDPGKSGTVPPRAKGQANRSHTSANIVREKVVSSNVFSVGYDNASKTLQVEFKNGSVYEYYDVPVTVFQQFIAAKSKGRFVSFLHGFRHHRLI